MLILLCKFLLKTYYTIRLFLNNTEAQLSYSRSRGRGREGTPLYGLYIRGEGVVFGLSALNRVYKFG